MAIGLVTFVVAAGCSSKASTSGQTTGRRVEANALPPAAPGEPRRSERVLEVVATTSVAADWLRVVGSTNVRTHVMVKAGLDPVAYLTTPSDVEAVRRADVVVAFGRGLEPWLDGVRQQAAGQARLVTLTDGLPQRTTASGHPDPFAWLDLANAKQMVTALTATLAAADAADQPAFDFARDAYLLELDRADTEARRVLAPVVGRGLVTAKETFGWFAASYGLTVVGAVVPTVDGQADSPPQHLALLRQAIAAGNVRAVFAESSVPDASVRAVARDSGVKPVVGPEALVGDGLGAAGTESDTFLGAVRHNARAVADNV